MSSQILPGLKVFCISSAIAIAAIFILQASWFVAFLTLDQMRIEALRDGLFPCCLVHKDFDFEENSGKEWSKIIITKVGAQKSLYSKNQIKSSQLYRVV